MSGLLRRIFQAIIGESGADRVVPASGADVWLTGLASGAIAFLAVFALSLAFSAGRLASSWSSELAGTATVRIEADGGDMAAREQAVLHVLDSTPGIAGSRVVSNAEKLALLQPWLGADLPPDAVPLPGIVEITAGSPAPDMASLSLRLTSEVPGAVLDDHQRWTAPLASSARQLRWVTWAALGLIGATFVAVITLAARASLAANTGVISTLRLIGATDAWVARAFVRRFTLRAAAGAGAGMLAALLILIVLPRAGAESFLPSLRFTGWAWLLPLVVPVLAAITAFWATRSAAMRALRRLP